jgi:hypothetical protein
MAGMSTGSNSKNDATTTPTNNHNNNHNNNHHNNHNNLYPHLARMDLDQRQRLTATQAERPPVSCTVVCSYWRRLVCANLTWFSSSSSTSSSTSTTSSAASPLQELQEIHATSSHRLVPRLGSVTMMCFVDEAAVCERGGSCVEEIAFVRGPDLHKQQQEGT